MLSLGVPLALLLLPLPLLIWRLAPPHRQQVGALRIPFFRQITQATDVDARQGAVILIRTRIQMIVAIAIWFLVVLSLARPERLGEPVTIEKSARDVVIALDISGSMDERDFVLPDGKSQQRLASVKSVVSEFIATRENDRMALIVFGTRAFVQAPFTEDLKSLQGFLDQTFVGMAGPNTALGDAVGLAMRLFDASEVDHKLLILLSDGADTGSKMSPANAAAIAADRDVTIHTIGVGDPKASGSKRVDLAALKSIATQTGGSYFFASDQSALAGVYSEIDALAPRVTETTSFRPRDRLAHIPLAAALVLLIVAVGAFHFGSNRREAT